MVEKYHIKAEKAEEICLDPNYNVSLSNSTPCIEYSNCNLSSFYWGQVRWWFLFGLKLRENR